ncbi:hypothetical protein KSP40_PGU012864 [Platanthera guangdongensis]|uniref:Uncharacterized protein n=1 Tax=Platanthera guangdongensis TaxID=2320717 RepID=A0ABR2M1X9_9ASPA
MAPTAAMLFFCYQRCKSRPPSFPHTHPSHSFNGSAGSVSFRFSLSNGGGSSLHFRKTPDAAAAAGKVGGRGDAGDEQGIKFTREP